VFFNVIRCSPPPTGLQLPRFDHLAFGLIWHLAGAEWLLVPSQRILMSTLGQQGGAAVFTGVHTVEALCPNVLLPGRQHMSELTAPGLPIRHFSHRTQDAAA
jgi:hypothetical protein